MSTNKPTKSRAATKKLIKEGNNLIKAALAEDLGKEGDITTSATVPIRKKGLCRIIAKEDLVLAGLFLAEGVFTYLEKGIKFEALEGDGAGVKKGRTIATVRGPLAPMLTGERVALNLLQRLSGIATMTAAFVQKAPGVDILDTRKTTPLLRAFERYAVGMGGGVNHRSGLYDAVLIKDNHIKAAGGILKAIKKVHKSYGMACPVEVEVTTMKEAREAVAGGADIIMLDNMDPVKIRKALKIIKGNAVTEVSGGVNLENISEYAATGVDRISVGALTHSAPAVDISMKVAEDNGRKKNR
ncbi:MAG: carboxylating nicotinate-nucleotide diphosphorylase [Thermodesulfobacteriota bacterium]